jgi:hypothetical protein
MIHQGADYAVFYLDQLELHPTRLLELSRMFSVEKWVGPALKRLMRMELSSLSEKEVNRIGFKVYIIIAKAKERMENERKLVSAYPPPINTVESWDCYTHAKCKSVWREGWLRTVGRQILHPTNPLSFEDTIPYIQGMEHPGMTGSCKQETVEMLKVTGFLGEGVIVQGAIDAIIRFNNTL